jgi:hypothetical protein
MEIRERRYGFTIPKPQHEMEKNMQLHFPGVYPHKNIHNTHCMGGWLHTAASLDTMQTEKSLALTGDLKLVF